MKANLKKIAAAVFAGLVSPLLIGAGPTTMPAATRVEIFAFTPITKSDAGDWTGRGIQQNLQSDVSHTGATLVMPQHADGSTPDAMNEARQNHADLAVIGTYQVVGNQIRVNANLVEVATNTSVGGFSATGKQEDIFKVEDALGEQLRLLLPRPMTVDQVAQAFVEPPIPPVIQQPVYYSAPTPTYDGSAAPVYVAPDYYDGYYDNYPFAFYGGLGFYGGGYYGDYRGRGYSHYQGRGFTGHPGFAPNPSFHNPVYRGGNAFSAPHIGNAGVHGGGFSGGGFSGGGGHGGGGGGGHR